MRKSSLPKAASVANAIVNNPPGDFASPGEEGVGARGDEATEIPETKPAPQMGAARRADTNRGAAVGFWPLVDPWGFGEYWLQSVRAWQVLANATAVAAQKLMMRQFTEAAIEKWVDIDADANHPAGTSAGGRLYTYIKDQTQGSFDKFWPRWLIKPQIMHNPKVQDRMRNEEMAEQFGMVDAFIKKIYKRKYPEKAAHMRWQGTLFDEDYNHKFLTEMSHEGKPHGKIVGMDVDAIVKLFHRRTPRGAIKGEHFPHIIITSSHAQGETENDVRSITHGIEAMARDTHGKGEKLRHCYIDKGFKPGKPDEMPQTLILYACDVEETPWKNGKALLERVLELKRIEKTGKPETEFKHISPGAKRIAKLMLKCMVTEPWRITVDKEPRGMAEINASSSTPITLREDAVEIAHHFQLVGYSKGGNVVSDAMRYLVSELTAKRADGKDVFEKHARSRTRAPNDQSMSEHNVRNIVRSIATLALASVEVGMSKYLIDHGVRRDAVNSDKDAVSAHQNYESNPPYDRRWIVKGEEAHLGHAPHQMMGMRGEMQGYVHKDERVARRLKEFFASNYGKAAIGRITFDEAAAQGQVTIEAATGTTDKQIEKHKEVIIEAVAEALGIVPAPHKKGIISKLIPVVDPNWPTLTSDITNPGIFTLTCKGFDFAHRAELVDKLYKAFDYLRSDDIQGLVITQSILDKGGDIDQQMAKAKPQDNPTVEQEAKRPLFAERFRAEGKGRAHAA